MIPYMYANEFLWQKSSIESTRPAATMGTSITPGNNTKGSYSSAILSSSDIAFDVCGVAINFNSGATLASARDIIVDIGVDPAGGTSYSVLIPDLLASCASTLAQSCGINYYFPIFIKAGSSIAARASVNNATVGSLSCNITVFGKPANPSMTRVGTSVVAFGITSASSRGTTATVDGSTWTTLASSITSSPWYWQIGMGVSDTTMTNGNIYHAKLAHGDASNKHIIIEAAQWEITTANENLSGRGVKFGCNRYVKSGQNLYVQANVSGTSDSNVSYAAYGVVGG